MVAESRYIIGKRWTKTDLLSGCFEDELRIVREHFDPSRRSRRLRHVHVLVLRSHAPIEPLGGPEKGPLSS